MTSKCTFCGASEVDANTPRSVYACGTSSYDDRPGSFRQSEQCKAQCGADTVSEVVFGSRYAEAKSDGVAACEPEIVLPRPYDVDESKYIGKADAVLRGVLCYVRGVASRDVKLDSNTLKHVCDFGELRAGADVWLNWSVSDHATAKVTYTLYRAPKWLPQWFRNLFGTRRIMVSSALGRGFNLSLDEVGRMFVPQRGNDNKTPGFVARFRSSNPVFNVIDGVADTSKVREQRHTYEFLCYGNNRHELETAITKAVIGRYGDTVGEDAFNAARANGIEATITDDVMFSDFENRYYGTRKLETLGLLKITGTGNPAMTLSPVQSEQLSAVMLSVTNTQKSKAEVSIGQAIARYHSMRNRMTRLHAHLGDVIDHETEEPLPGHETTAAEIYGKLAMTSVAMLKLIDEHGPELLAQQYPTEMRKQQRR